MGDIVLAADLGGTNLRMAAVDVNGSIKYRTRCTTPHGHDKRTIIDAISDLARESLSEIKGAGSVVSLGVAVPAVMDIPRGIIHRAPNLSALDGVYLSDELKKEIGLTVVLENDATSAAIGEHWLGASKNVDNSICVTLGTGVGGGIILDGKPVRGPDGTGGEIGHICVEPDGRPCGCGSWGCIEQYSSATAVVRIAEELAADSSNSSIIQKNGLTSQELYRAAVDRNSVAVEAFRRMGYYLGIALAGLINTLNPEVIVLAGGLSAAWEVFIEHTRDQIAKRAFREPAARAKLVRAELGDDAGILGVASLAFSTAKQGILEG
jgi:glucokinase